MYLAFGIIFLLIAAVITGFIVVTTVCSIRGKGEALNKKNMLYLAPVFLLIYFLYVTATAYNGKKFDFFYCFSLINSVLDALKFKSASELITPLCEKYPIFYADFVIAYLLGTVTVILSIASFFSRRINNYFCVKNALRNKCDIVVGDSVNSVNYVKRTKNSLLLGVNVTSQRYVDLIKQGVPVLRVPLETKPLAGKLKKGGYELIVFRDGKIAYSKIIETFTELSRTFGIKIHLEAAQQEMKILKEKFITKADKNSNLYISGFSKYGLMARKFVTEYPITKYIPRSFYNGNFTVKSDKQINVVFIGFGKVNYQLFRMCAMQFQFAREDGGRLASKPVKYYVYDNKEESLHNEFFSRILYEFDEEFADCDFPKPEKICDLEICRADINSVEAKKNFRSLVSENSFTYFIVSLDDDLQDASYAQTVKRVLGDDENYRVFVRAKNDNGENLNDGEDRVIYFGEDKKLYTRENIINDDLCELAQRINLLYNKISNPPEWLKSLKSRKDLTAKMQGDILGASLAEPKNKEYMIKKWSTLPYIEQASNLYHALNLPFKLNLMGFEMVKKTETDVRGITEEEFFEYYENSGKTTGYSDYSFFFKTQSSNVLAYIEHSRWNALYILYDYKQMKKEDMEVTEDTDGDGNIVTSMSHKDSARKRHACITSYYGLNELISYKYGCMYGEELDETKYKNNVKLQELAKIYAYDYMDLDRIYSEITAMGYVIKHIK